MPLNTELAELIASAMDRKKITAAEFAAKLEMDTGFLNRILMGERLPSRSTLVRICEALDLDPTEAQRISSWTQVGLQHPELFQG